jgi:hypothetical protein
VSHLSTDADSYAYCNADSYCNSDSYGDLNGFYTNTYSNGYAYADSYAYCDSNSHRNCYCYGECDTYRAPHPDTKDWPVTEASPDTAASTLGPGRRVTGP